MEKESHHHRQESLSFGYAPRGLLATTLGKERGDAAGGGMWDTCFQGPDYPPSPSYTRTSLCSRNVPVDKTPEAQRPDLYLVWIYRVRISVAYPHLRIILMQVLRNDIPEISPWSWKFIVPRIILMTEILRGDIFSLLHPFSQKISFYFNIN